MALEEMINYVPEIVSASAALGLGYWSRSNVGTSDYDFERDIARKNAYGFNIPLTLLNAIALGVGNYFDDSVFTIAEGISTVLIPTMGLQLGKYFYDTSHPEEDETFGKFYEDVSFRDRSPTDHGSRTGK